MAIDASAHLLDESLAVLDLFRGCLQCRLRSQVLLLQGGVLLFDLTDGLLEGQLVLTFWRQCSSCDHVSGLSQRCQWTASQGDAESVAAHTPAAERASVCALGVAGGAYTREPSGSSG